MWKKSSIGGDIEDSCKLEEGIKFNTYMCLVQQEEQMMMEGKFRRIFQFQRKL